MGQGELARRLRYQGGMLGPGPLYKSDVFQSVAEIIGAAATERLCAAIGGKRVYVPKTICEDHLIFQAVGKKNAALIAEFFHHTVLSLPSGLPRRKRVLELHRTTTMTVRDLALATGYTEAGVYKILKEARGDRDRTASFGQEAEQAFGDDGKICVVTVARRVAGEDISMRIRAHFAGTRIYIPQIMPEDHELSQLVGWEVAKLIANEIGGVHSDVDSGSVERVKALENAIRWASLAGIGGRAIARLVDRTDRHVRHVISGLRRLGRLPHKEGADA